jgi:hypothetical protein
MLAATLEVVLDLQQLTVTHGHSGDLAVGALGLEPGDLHGVKAKQTIQHPGATRRHPL